MSLGTFGELAKESLNNDVSDPITRSSENYIPRYERFMKRGSQFTVQFNNIYTHRTEDIRPVILDTAKSKWCSGNNKARICRSVIDIGQDSFGSDIVLSGVIYKEMRLKPNVLDYFNADRGLDAPQPRVNFAAETDTLIMEDETGRVTLKAAPGLELQFECLVGLLVTGVVMGVLGTPTEAGNLEVKDVCFAGFSRGPWRGVSSDLVLPRPIVRASGKFVLLVSGLHVGSASRGAFSLPLALQQLSEFVGGLSGLEKGAQGQIIRVIIAGGLVGSPSPSQLQAQAQVQAAASGSLAKSSRSARTFLTPGDLPSSSTSIYADRQLTRGEIELATDPIRAADVFLSSLLPSVPVDVLPGFGEPSSLALPQIPFHPCLFPRASGFSSLRSTTNPYECSLGDVRLLGHSGQPVYDLSRFVRPAAAAVDIAAPYSSWIASIPSQDAEEVDEEQRQERERERRLEELALMEAGDDDMALLNPATREEASADPQDNKRTENRLELLRRTLLWRHLAPSAPDTLVCQPLIDLDPFIIKELPHVYFCGCDAAGGGSGTEIEQAQLQTQLVPTGAQSIRLVALPDFSLTATAVLVNIESPELDIQPIVFKQVA